ncbi:hypothetical protein AL01_00320 [Bombella intestini]|uniref:Uncharacterized protein n=1 Tax=Bombella intestini TaxID=1539051 RepID=A0A1S8GQZ0_9PROT|nr:hypothetical protein AL01_00320 [Bombella intestini]
MEGKGACRVVLGCIQSCISGEKQAREPVKQRMKRKTPAGKPIQRWKRRRMERRLGDIRVRHLNINNYSHFLLFVEAAVNGKAAKWGKMQ